MYGNLAWLEFAEPQVTVRVGLQDPTRIPAPRDLPYCCHQKCKDKAHDEVIKIRGSCECAGMPTKSYECMALDAAEANEVFEQSIFVISRKTDYHQRQNSSCNDQDVKCTREWITEEERSGSYYVAYIEGFQLTVAHTIFEKELGTHLSNGDMKGFLRVAAGTNEQRQLCKSRDDAVTEPYDGVGTDDSPCYIKPGETTGDADKFNLDLLLQAMGIKLDVGASVKSWESIRATGMAVNMEVEYFNSFPWVGRIGEVRYVYKLRPMRKSGYRRVSTKGDSSELSADLPSTRVVEESHGLLISITASGQLGLTSWANVVEAAAVVLALASLTEFIMRKVVMQLLSYREFYYAYMTQVSGDFGVIPELEDLDPRLISEALKRRHLSTQGSKKELIFRLLDAGWHPHQRFPLLDDDGRQTPACSPVQDVKREKNKRPDVQPVERRELADKLADEILHSKRTTRNLQEELIGTLPDEETVEKQETKVGAPIMDLAPVDFGQAFSAEGTESIGLGPRVSKLMRDMPADTVGPKFAAKPSEKKRPASKKLVVPTPRTSSRSANPSPRATLAKTGAVPKSPIGKAGTPRQARDPHAATPRASSLRPPAPRRHPSAKSNASSSSAQSRASSTSAKSHASSTGVNLQARQLAKAKAGKAKAAARASALQKPEEIPKQLGQAVEKKDSVAYHMDTFDG